MTAKRLQEYIIQEKQLDVLLDMSLSNIGLNEIIKKISNAMNCDILVIDRNGNMIAESADFFEKNNLIVTEKITDDRIKKEMYFQNQHLGSIYFINNQRMFPEYVERVTQLLAKQVWQNHLVSSANSRLEDRLVHLLVNRQQNLLEKEMDENKIYLPKSFAFILVKPQTFPDYSLKQQLQLEFNKEMGFAISSIFRNILISLVKMPVSNYYSNKLTAALSKISKKYNIQLVVTNPCQDILELRENYLAGKLVYQNSDQSDPVIFVYQQNLTLFNKNLFNNSLNEYFIPPVITYLKAYDQKNNSSFLNTLFAFINNDCNIEQTAEKLFMHRNTVSNHLHKIRQLTNFDIRHFADLFWVKQYMLLERIYFSV